MISLKNIYGNLLMSFVMNLWEIFYNLFYSSDIVTPAVKELGLEADPLRASYVRSIPRSQVFRNVLLQGYLVSPSLLKGLEGFEIRSDDIFLVTYPKSGTTWTEEILSLIVNDGDVSKVSNIQLSSRVTHLEVGMPIGHLTSLGYLSSPRLMATHLSFPLIPKQLRQAKCKIIYVVRNPKDNAVSYFHHHRISTFLGKYTGSWDEFFSLYLNGNLVYGSWFDHVLPYWKLSREHPDKVLFISYEELKMDLPGMITRISQFIDHPLRPQIIQDIALNCSFEKMKDNNMVNREALPVPDLYDMKQSKFMRKGIIGDWMNYFTPTQNDEFETLYNRRMRDSGLDLVFNPEDAFRRMSLHGRLILDNATFVKNVRGNRGGHAQKYSAISQYSRNCATFLEEDLEEEAEPLIEIEVHGDKTKRMYP